MSVEGDVVCGAWVARVCMCVCVCVCVCAVVGLWQEIVYVCTYHSYSDFCFITLTVISVLSLLQ
jgi:hypothetical protein